MAQGPGLFIQDLPLGLYKPLKQYDNEKITNHLLINSIIYNDNKRSTPASHRQY